jgi:hypothetical protein
MKQDAVAQHKVKRNKSICQNSMPARLMTSPHLAESRLMVAANSSGVPPPGSSPVLANFSLKASEVSAFLIAALSLSTIPRGTPAGAMTPV